MSDIKFYPDSINRCPTCGAPVTENRLFIDGLLINQQYQYLSDTRIDQIREIINTSNETYYDQIYKIWHIVKDKI